MANGCKGAAGHGYAKWLVDTKPKLSSEKAYPYTVRQLKLACFAVEGTYKARDQKQLYRLNETKSHSGGGFEICQAVSFALFLAFLAP